MSLIHIGHGNYVHAGRILAVVPAGALPIRQRIQAGRKDGRTIDLSAGHKTKSVIISHDGLFLLSAVTPEAVKGRMADQVGK